MTAQAGASGALLPLWANLKLEQLRQSVACGMLGQHSQPCVHWLLTSPTVLLVAYSMNYCVNIIIIFILR